MSISIVNSFAVATKHRRGQPVQEGPHIEASNQLKYEMSKIARTMKVPKNRRDRITPKRANIVLRYFDARMQLSVDKKRGIYYKNANGIDVVYPRGSKVIDLSELDEEKINKNPNNFNVFIGCDKRNGTSQRL